MSSRRRTEKWNVKMFVRPDTRKKIPGWPDGNIKPSFSKKSLSTFFWKNNPIRIQSPLVWFFPKLTRISKSEYGNFLNEILDQDQQFKQPHKSGEYTWVWSCNLSIFWGYISGEKLRKYGSKLGTSEPRPKFTGSCSTVLYYTSIKL